MYTYIYVCVYASFVCTLPFIAVFNRFSRCLITVFSRFDRCLNLFQSITRHWIQHALELNYFVFENFYLLPFLGKGPFILFRQVL